MINDLDYKLLRYFKNSKTLTLDQMLSKFPENRFDTTERLSRFVELRLTEELTTTAISESGFEIVTGSGTYTITSHGRRVASDYRLERRERIKETLWRFRVPLLFSFLALLKSYWNEVIWIYSQLAQLWR